MTVTPWEVKNEGNGIDYTKLVEQFGCSLIDDSLIAKFETVIGQKVHYLIRRGLFFSHRDLEMILDCKAKNVPFYLYTGRGPSSESLHLGHLLPFFLVKWLQDVFDCPLVIQLTDDEKFLFKKDLTLQETVKMGVENVKDILSCGLNIHKTFIFSNMSYVKELYPTMLKIQKNVTFNQVKGIFGFNESSSIGTIAFPAIQAAPCFPCVFPKFLGDEKYTRNLRCLVPCAIDQDPYFRMTRDVAPKLGYSKPALLLGVFVPALQGSQSKMSSSTTSSAIFINDTPETVTKKIRKYAFSGGRQNIEDHRKYGANIEQDVSIQYLRFFLEDDEKLKQIETDYASGKLLTSEVKRALIDHLNGLLATLQKNRSEIDDEIINYVFNPDRNEVRTKIENQCKLFNIK